MDKNYLGNRSMLDEMPTDLSWKELEDSTNGFAEQQKIGSGGYGVVYKGVYRNREIAVKKLYHMPGLDEEQYQNELRILTRLRHQNIIRLVGKSCEEQDRCVEYNGKLVFAKMVDRVICLEYLHKGSLENHLSDESSGITWRKRYKIIKGTCEGLKYLHEQSIFHLDLKPANILLDDNMLPKIADFGLSKLFSGTRRSHTTIHFIGTLGYVPPEYIEKGKISDKFDVFSLGVIIIRIMAGPGGYSKLSDMSPQDFVELVHVNWKQRLQDAGWKDGSYLDAYCNQVKTCIEIALKCVEKDRHKRPSIGDIVHSLNGTEATIGKLFVVYPLNPCIPFKPNKLIPCQLHLTNNADHQTAFMIRPRTPGIFAGSHNGIVPAKSSLTYILTMQKQQQPPSDVDNILIQSFEYFDDSSDLFYDSDFDDGHDIHYEIKDVAIKRFVDNASQSTQQQQIQLGIELDQILLPQHDVVEDSIDVHPMEPWILLCHTFNIFEIWNYRTKAKLDLSYLQQTGGVTVARFIAHKQWIVAGHKSGYMDVYCYKTMQHLEYFKAHEAEPILDLAVHPTKPYVMSTSFLKGNNVKLWDWEKGWECIRTFDAGFNYAVEQARFNQMDTETFAVRGDAGIVKICSIRSPAGSNFILDEYKNNGAFCFDYFANGGKQYLIMGDRIGTVKIWDLQTKTHIEIVESVHIGRVTAVCSLPKHPVLVTGSFDGTVCLWNPTTLRPERTFNFGLGHVWDVKVVCIHASRSYTIVILHKDGLGWIEIDRGEAVCSTGSGGEESDFVGSRKRKLSEQDRV